VAQIKLITADTTEWVAGTYEGYSYKKTIPISGITISDFPFVAYNLETKSIAQDSGITYVESYNGGIYLYAESLPESPITFNLSIMKG